MIEHEKYLKDPKFLQWLNEPDDEIEEYWEKWKAHNPGQEGDLNQARAYFKSIRFRQYPVDERKKQSDWQKIQRATSNGRQNRRVLWPVYYKAAAAFLLVAVSVFLLRSISNQHPVTEIEAVAMVTKETGLGQKLTIQLPDGSIVKLNSGSTLTYPSEFPSNLRQVELTGEGFFTVNHDAKRPFQVVAQDVHTKVLGTAFNINSYDACNIEVALVEGIVEVHSGADEKARLSPGEKAIWKSDHFRIEKLDKTADIGWKDNILVFYEDNIDQIRSKLERWYGVNITVQQPDRISHSFVGEFQNESLVNVLEIIGHALRFRYQINNESITLKPIEYDK
jgi:transmembrane sensor